LEKIRLVITGNPGVGKHTSAKIIAERINAEIIDINEVAIDNNATGKKTDLGLDVDVKRRLLKREGTVLTKSERTLQARS
jgi:broad-specificity NMP kinase